MDVRMDITGNFLGKEDILEPVKVTVAEVTREELKTDNGHENKILVRFKEIQKPLILNKTNLKRCCQAFDSTDTTDWIGKPLVLYVDEDVEFGGKVVGGLRVRRAKQNGKPAQPKPEPVSFDDDDIPF